MDASLTANRALDEAVRGLHEHDRAIAHWMADYLVSQPPLAVAERFICEQLELTRAWALEHPEIARELALRRVLAENDPC